MTLTLTLTLSLTIVYVLGHQSTSHFLFIDHIYSIIHSLIVSRQVLVLIVLYILDACVNNLYSTLMEIDLNIIHYAGDGQYASSYGQGGAMRGRDENHYQVELTPGWR